MAAMAAAALAVLSFLCLAFYQLVTYRRYLHSDSAIKNLLAQEIVDSGRFLPPDWFYGNSDIWIAYNHLFIVPLLSFMPNGFRVHAVSGVMFSILFGLSAWWFFKRAALPPVWRGIALAVLFSGISPYLSETLYGQVSHGYAWTLIYLFLLLAWLPGRLLAQGAPRPALAPGLDARSVAVWLLLTAVFVVGGLTGIRMAFSIVIPVAVLCAACAAKDWLHAKPIGRWLLLALWAGASWLAGYALHKTALGHLHYFDLSQAQRWADFPQVGTNLRYFIEGWFLNSGISLEDDPTGTFFSLHNEPVASLRGMEFVYRFVLNLFMFFLPWTLVLGRWRQIGSPWLRAMLGFYVVGFVLTLVLFLFSTGLAVAPASIRYFTVFHVLSFLIAIFWCAGQSMRFRGHRAAVVAVLALLPLFAFSWRHHVGDAFVRNEAGKLERAYGRFAPLLHVLNENRLHHGYATFWNAAAPTVLSDHRIVIRSLYVTEAGIVPMHVLSARRHYEAAEQSKQPSFLVLRTDEYDNEAAKYGALVDAKLGKPDAIHRVPGFEVRTYPDDILKRLAQAGG